MDGSTVNSKIPAELELNFNFVLNMNVCMYSAINLFEISLICSNSIDY